MKPTMDLRITRAVPSSQMTKTTGIGYLWKWKQRRKRSAKGFITRMSLVPTSTGLSSRNANLAYRLVTTALKKKYGQGHPAPCL